MEPRIDGSEIKTRKQAVFVWRVWIWKAGGDRLHKRHIAILYSFISPHGASCGGWHRAALIGTRRRSRADATDVDPKATKATHAPHSSSLLLSFFFFFNSKV